MKKYLMYLVVIVFVLVSFVSCGRYIGEYALSSQYLDSIVESFLISEGLEDTVDYIKKMAKSIAAEKIGDISFTFNEDRTLDVSWSGETMSLSLEGYEVSETAFLVYLLLNNIDLGTP